MRNLMSLNSLTDHLIRPAKFTYSMNDLGPSIFQINNSIYERSDFSVKSQNNKTIQASYWAKKLGKTNPKSKNPFLIYLHCNCGSRIEGMQLVNKSLELGYNFVVYDSRGCGHSSGQYISLGYYEIYDLEAVINYIAQNINDDPQIILWGRSMGAVTSIKFLANSSYKYSNNVKVAVLDSPFINLKQVIHQIMNKKVGAPKLLIDLFVSYMEPLVQQKAGFKISQFDLRKQIGKIKSSLILMASKSDQLVPFKHLQQIYELHKGKKSIFYLNQSHTEQRSNQTIQKIYRTIQRYFLSERKSNDYNLEGFQSLAKTADSVDLKKYRFTQFDQSKSNKNKNSVQKSKSNKKITITYPFVSSRIQQLNKLQLSLQKDGHQVQFSKTSLKKKKLLSLNCSKSSIKSNSQANSNIKTVCRPIQLFKSFERKAQAQKYDQNKCNTNLILRQKVNLTQNSIIKTVDYRKQDIKINNGHKRANSNMESKTLNKQNSIRKIVTQFTQPKQVKRQVKILNVIAHQQ